MAFQPNHSFQTLAGVPVHYARSPVAPYGTRGQPRRWHATPDFERRLDRAFAELWQHGPSGPAEVITSAGAWVDKPGYHGRGRAFDLDGLFWPAGTEPREQLIATSYGDDAVFYLAVESILRRHFGTVLNFLYDAAHRDHWHLDDGTPVAWDPGSRSRVLYVQAALRQVYGHHLVVDGEFGPITEAALRRTCLQNKVPENLTVPEAWRAFLLRTARVGFAQTRRGPQEGPGHLFNHPIGTITTSITISETVEQVRLMRQTSDSQFERLERMLEEITRDPERYLREPPGAPPPPRFSVRGRLSTFGGPEDEGVAPGEGMALYEPHQMALHPELFLPAQPPGTTGLARRLNPEVNYLACRWDYGVHSKEELREAWAAVRNPRTGAMAMARPVDWGPAVWTGRVADLSPALARTLALQTDDQVEVALG